MKTYIVHPSVFLRRLFPGPQLCCVCSITWTQPALGIRGGREDSTPDLCLKTFSSQVGKPVTRFKGLVTHKEKPGLGGFICLRFATVPSSFKISRFIHFVL